VPVTTASKQFPRPIRPRLVRGAAIAACFWASAASAQTTKDLNGRVEGILSNSRVAGAKVGVSIVDLQTGRVVTDIQADTPLIPASNMKLLTSGAAAIVLGNDFAFKTQLLMDGDRLIVRGSGDPALADSVILDQMPGKMSVEALVDALVASVKKAGVERVSEVIVDDRIFDREFVHSTWPKDQLDRWYCAEVSGLNFHTNVISFFPSPSGSGVGRPPTLLLEPLAPWLEIENKARTAESGRNSIWLTRDGDTNRYTVLGDIGVSRVRVEVTLHDPAMFTGRLIASSLPKAGVAVGSVAALADAKATLSRDQANQAVKAVRLAQTGETLDGRVIAVVTTHLEEVLNRCNSDSYNLYAEAMLKRMGHEVTGEPGSWSNGASVLRMTLTQHLGPEAASSTVIADGSGMSRENRVTPRTLTRWLEFMAREPKAGPIFMGSLATPERRDSMRRRFRDVRLGSDLSAKSGTIDGVRCLSGYLTDPVTGRRLAFSILVNDVKEGEQALQALQFHQAVVAEADRWLIGQRPARTPGAPAPKPSARQSR